MAKKNNPIKSFLDNGWRMTSDATWFKDFGRRELYAYGENVDSYCGGFHRAFDLAKTHGVAITSAWNATVLRGTGWNTFGWTTVLGFIDHEGIPRQMILGHLDKNPLTFLRVGQNVKRGDVIGHQGASNNLGVNMASHLHIQFQNFQSLNEWNFTCLGLNAYNIDTTTTRPTGDGTPERGNEAAFNKYTPRRNRRNHYFSGVIQTNDGRGAAVRKFNGGNFNVAHDRDLRDGERVFIFEVHRSGFARVYSSANDGWVHLDRVRVTGLNL